MKSYPVLRSTLEGIFGSGVGLSDDDATSSLTRDLSHRPFLDALSVEIDAAMKDSELSWRHLLEEAEVAYFDTDEEAKAFVVQRIVKLVIQPR